MHSGRPARRRGLRAGHVCAPARGPRRGGRGQRGGCTARALRYPARRAVQHGLRARAWQGTTLARGVPILHGTGSLPPRRDPAGGARARDGGKRFERVRAGGRRSLPPISSARLGPGQRGPRGRLGGPRRGGGRGRGRAPVGSAAMLLLAKSPLPVRPARSLCRNARTAGRSRSGRRARLQHAAGRTMAAAADSGATQARGEGAWPVERLAFTRVGPARC
mmetsp:Transcript_47175/g.110131  ORF Transcript_47175/g.110131 Transcript_47175/m.110131 type:complete len:220 (-) Transcript_47175:1413-2072(-)